VVEADSVPAEASAAIFIERVYLPERKKQTQLLTGDPRQAAAQLIEKLRFEARVL
jgi:electron transfer flavoprotein beta subunit